MVTTTRRSASFATTLTPCAREEIARPPATNIPAAVGNRLGIGLSSHHHLLSRIVEGNLLASLDCRHIHTESNGMAVAGLDWSVWRFARAHTFHPVAHVGRC